MHGIGAQRRGDALVQCATALHKWLRGWLTQEQFGEDLSIDLVDASVAESGPDHPAQVRIIFRQGNQVSRVSWLLAESCWFDTYRRPSFFEFARWALRVLPVAVVIHFLPHYRRAWNAFKASAEALESGKLNPPQFLAIAQGLGLAAETKRQDVAQRRFLENSRNLMMWRCLEMQFKLALLAAAALVIQVLLVAVTILAIIPGPTRSLARWVQLKLSATLGDSYLFVTSPLTGAAIATRVKKDLKWLTERCDRVIVVAHSQGAAVSYSAVEREFWGGSRPEKLHALVTYGSGLRKLFDLERTDRDFRFWSVLGIYAMTVPALMTCLIILFLAGAVPWWGALPGMVLGIMLQMVPLVRPQELLPDPPVLRVPWYDCYSSHDPVPNGPIDFKRAELSEDVTIERAIETYMDSGFVSAFKTLQREVVNRRSLLADHTSYWSSQDDFVAHIAGILAKASDIPIHLTLDQQWLQIATERRRWRVSWLSRCRAVAGLLAISILLWPREVLDPVGTYVRAGAAPASTLLPQNAVALGIGCMDPGLGIGRRRTDPRDVAAVLGSCDGMESLGEARSDMPLSTHSVSFGANRALGICSGLDCSSGGRSSPRPGARALHLGNASGDDMGANHTGPLERVVRDQVATRSQQRGAGTKRTLAGAGDTGERRSGSPGCMANGTLLPSCE